MKYKIAKMTKPFLLFLLTSVLLVGCSSKNNSDKFIGKWVNNGGGSGLNMGAVVDISSAGGSLVVNLDPKSGFSGIQNTGTYEDGKINVSLPQIGQTQITYSEENGEPHIYFIGVKLDKQR